MEEDPRSLIEKPQGWVLNVDKKEPHKGGKDALSIRNSQYRDQGPTVG